MTLKAKLLVAYLVLLVASRVTVESVRDSREEGDRGIVVEKQARKLIYLIPGATESAEEYERLGEAVESGAVGLAFHATSAREASGFEKELSEFLESHPEVEVQFVGVGYSGGAALQLASRFPGAATGVTLVSSPISPRLELLGDPTLNKALKGFQLAVAWLLDYGAPHFGFLDRTGFDHDATSRIYGADLDAGERLFETLELPISLVAGESDRFLPPDAIAAYQMVRPDLQTRLYPNSGDELEERSISRFASDLIQLSAMGGKGVGGARGIRSFEDLPGVALDPWLAGGLLAFATFASEDLACIGGGLLAASGSVSLAVAVLGCLIGIFVGDFAIYLIGRGIGSPALRLPILRRLATPGKVTRISRWFERRGVMLVVLTRFLPGSRVPTYFTAGVVKVGALRFAGALLFASAVWTPILVVLAYFLGERFLDWFERLGAYGWLGIVGFLLAFVFGSRMSARLMTWRGRRLLYSKFQRLRKWEFWPMWALYAPVLVYIGWLMIRFRSVTLPTAVNPCMPASGLVYESKSQILSHLRKFKAPVARFEVICSELDLAEKERLLAAFMEREGLRFPVVLKPDVGQRGQGVAIVDSLQEARDYLNGQVEDTIAQEYVGGVEYGVFYYRFRDRSLGRVSSVTDKRMTYVVGDGASTLERLILQDPRAVCMADFFLRTFESQLDWVVPAGERFQLAKVGTHCRGALFLDGEVLITQELEAEVDRFSAGIEGFHFGRYDVRVPSSEALRRGEGIRIIELNGLTSEPTSMYDPRHSIWFAWGSLMRQWRLIFELAQKNRLAGDEPVSVKFVLKLAYGHFRGVPSRDLF